MFYNKIITEIQTNHMFLIYNVFEVILLIEAQVYGTSCSKREETQCEKPVKLPDPKLLGAFLKV